MADKDLQEFKADHTGGDVVKGAEIYEPVVGAGGPVKKRLADVDKTVDPKAAKLGAASGVKTPGEGAMAESFDSLFEGMDISEDFKSKVGLVFEAAVNEAATEKAMAIAEELQEEFDARLEEAVNESMADIIENLDSYLDYVVAEWVAENEVAIESGIKVEMAESFMEGLKNLFQEHNVEIDEETLDIVSGLEEEVDDLVNTANAAINENIALKEEIAQLQAEQVFSQLAEGLTATEAERLRILSEKLDISNLDAFASNLETLKESFFKTSKSARYISEDLDEETEILTEEAAPSRVSAYDSVNAIVAALNAKQNQ